MSRIKAELIGGSGALSISWDDPGFSPTTQGGVGRAVGSGAESGFSVFHLPSAASSWDEPTSPRAPWDLWWGLGGLHRPGSAAGCDTGDTELIGISAGGSIPKRCVFRSLPGKWECWELKSKGIWARCLWTREEKMLDRARLISRFSPQQLLLISVLWGEVLYRSWGARCSQAASQG